MSTIRYLAYGSNLYPPRLAARLDGIIIAGSVALPGWSLRFHKLGADGSGKCDLVRDPDAIAFGAIYEISLADRARLDRIEGVGHGYRGGEIDVAGHGDVYVYRAERSHVDANLEPFDWYHGFVLAGARHHAFPPDYISQIERVVPIRDRDKRRRAENLEILGRIHTR